MVSRSRFRKVVHVHDDSLRLLREMLVLAYPSPIVIRFNYRRVNVERLREKIAKILNTSPDKVRLLSKVVVAGDYVFICRDENCSKVLREPLCTVDGFVLLRALLEE